MSLYEDALLAANLTLTDPFQIGLMGYGDPWNNRAYDLQDDLRQKFSFAIPNDKALEALSQLGAIVEVGAGSGYWTYELRQRGADVVCTDVSVDHPHWHFEKRWVPDILEMDAVEAVTKWPYRCLLIVWPDDFNKKRGWPSHCLLKYKGPVVAYVGEGLGGCTGDDLFHKMLNRNWKKFDYIPIPVWYGLRDTLVIYVRK